MGHLSLRVIVVMLVATVGLVSAEQAPDISIAEIIAFIRNAEDITLYSINRRRTDGAAHSV